MAVLRGYPNLDHFSRREGESSSGGEYSSEQVIAVRRTHCDGRKFEREREEEGEGVERIGEQPRLIPARDAHLHFNSHALAKISTLHPGRPVRASTRPRFDILELERRSRVCSGIRYDGFGIATRSFRAHAVLSRTMDERVGSQEPFRLEPTTRVPVSD